MRTNQNIWLLHENLTKIHDDGLTYFGSNEGLNTKNINSFTEFEIEITGFQQPMVYLNLMVIILQITL